MATYTLSPAGASFTTLPAPAADAWLQPVNGSIYVSDDATPSTATAGIIPRGVPYPVTAGKVLKVASAEPGGVYLRMWDK